MKRRFPRLYKAIYGDDEPASPRDSADAHSSSKQRPAAQQQQAGAPAAAPAAASRPAQSIHDLQSAQPLVVEAPLGDGGTQSLKWVDSSLRRDEDGDEAHAFVVVDPGA